MARKAHLNTNQMTFRFYDSVVQRYTPQTMTHMIIAIDGPAASGKGTLARRLAKRLGYDYLDTGALYRMVGKAVLDANQDPSSEMDATRAAKSLSTTLKPEDLQNPELRQDHIGQAASVVSVFPSVRQALLDFQKEFSTRNRGDGDVGGVILDGRDIGTVICPDANVKFFITASVEERAKRRYLELSAKGIKTTLDDVLNDMQIRDERDQGRDTAPLKPAKDAHILDTSTMSEADVMERALSIIRGHIIETEATR